MILSFILSLLLGGSACGKVDVVIVADYSGSMDGSEYHVTSAIEEFVESLDVSPEGVNIAIISFHSFVYVQTPLTGDRAQLRGAVSVLRKEVATGTTKMDMALSQAKVELFSQRLNATKIVVLITDGYPDSKESTSAEGRDLLNMGVRLCGVYIGDGDDGAKFLNDVTMGCYSRSTPLSLIEALKKITICL